MARPQRRSLQVNRRQLAETKRIEHQEATFDNEARKRTLMQREIFKKPALSTHRQKHVRMLIRNPITVLQE